jgi:ketosteroid isomerase-like protein
MSQENVERIRRGHGVISQSGWDSEDTVRIGTEMLHPDVEWHDQRELPGATVHQGVKEVERHLAAAQEALEYEAMDLDLLELLDADPCAVAVNRVRARGRASGVPVERDAVHVYRFRGPKIERVDIYGSRAEALEAAGLSERMSPRFQASMAVRTISTAAPSIPRPIYPVCIRCSAPASFLERGLGLATERSAAVIASARAVLKTLRLQLQRIGRSPSWIPTPLRPPSGRSRSW